MRAAIDAGATHVSPIMLHLRPGVREQFLSWLSETLPDLVPRYEAMYERAYVSAVDRTALARGVGGIVRALGGIRGRSDGSSRWGRDQAGGFGAERSRPAQLTLV